MRKSVELPHQDWRKAIRRIKLAAVRAKIEYLKPYKNGTK